MLAKLKKAGTTPSAILPVSKPPSPVAAPPPSSPAKGSKKKKKTGKKHKKKEKKVVEKEKENESEESSEEEKKPMNPGVDPAKSPLISVVNQKQPQLPGQVAASRPNPPGLAAQILYSERPDLIATSTLTPDEIHVLDDHLLKKGTFKAGNTITLGKIVDINSKLQVGSGDDVEVGALQAVGRFGAVYLVYKDNNSELEKRGLANFLALKISRRHLAAARIKHEIQILEHLYSANRQKSVAYPTHVTPLFFHGTAGGTPYLIMPMMDVNLEKIREEMGGKIAYCDAFYIAQESLVGIKECHTHSIIHRDIKPTNVLLSIQNNKSWWLCDFGDACSAGGKRILSPPDSCTLPFLSRDAHRAVKESVPSTTKMDIESWFYMVLDLFTPLPWKSQTDEAEILHSKQSFWQNPNTVLQSESLPSQLQRLARYVNGHFDDQIYSKLTVVLKDGFHKTLQEPWRPGWLEKRKRSIVPPSNRKPKNKKKKEERKEKEEKTAKKKL